MRPIQCLTDGELVYAREDCLAAIQANPRSSKLLDYIETIKACDEALYCRERLRIWRREIRQGSPDELTLPFRERLQARQFMCGAWRRWRELADSAAWNIAWLRLREARMREADSWDEDRDCPR